MTYSSNRRLNSVRADAAFATGVRNQLALRFGEDEEGGRLLDETGVMAENTTIGG